MKHKIETDKSWGYIKVSPARGLNIFSKSMSLCFYLVFKDLNYRVYVSELFV